MSTLFTGEVLPSSESTKCTNALNMRPGTRNKTVHHVLMWVWHETVAESLEEGQGGVQLPHFLKREGVLSPPKETMPLKDKNLD